MDVGLVLHRLRSEQHEDEGGDVKLGKKVEDKSRGKKRGEKKKEAPFGNYMGYYKKRLVGGGDPRLEFLDRNYFVHKRVLDVGCNDGFVTVHIASQCEPLLVRGMDFDASLVRAANNRLRQQEGEKKISRVEFVEGDATKDIGPAGGWDVVMLLSVTKWLHLNTGDEGVRKVFFSIHEALTSGGLFILEPQSYASYRKKAKTQQQRQILKQIQMRPSDFPKVLQEEFGFILEKEHAPDHTKNGFKRPLYIFRKT